MSKFVLATDSTNNRTVGTTQAVTTTSANYAVKTLNVFSNTIRIANAGNVGLYYALDDTTVTATTNDIFLPAGAVEFVNVPDALMGSRNIGFITASGTTSINITLGTEIV